MSVNTLPTMCASCLSTIPKECGWILEPTPGRFRAMCAGCYLEVDNSYAFARWNDTRLKSHQREGIMFLAKRRVACLADQQGLGKTIQALMALPADAPCVVVSPVSMVAEWGVEKARWRPDLFAMRLAGRSAFSWPEPGHFAASSYESLPDDPLPKPGTCLVLDEAHLKIKNPEAALTQRIRDVARHCVATGGRVWMLTATPLINKPDDLWEVLQTTLLGSAAFVTKRDFRALFKAYYDSPKGQRSFPCGQEREQIMQLLSRVMLRRLKKNLPDDEQIPCKRVEVVEVEITPEHAKIIHALVCRLVAAKRTNDAVKAGLLQDPRAPKLTKEERAARKARWKEHMGGALLMLTDPDEKEIKEAVELALLHRDQSPGFTELAAVRAALATAKIAAALELVDRFEAGEEPVVVFSAHRDPIDVLAGREGWAVITGAETGTRRTAAKDAFQKGELKGLGITIRAGGTGLTLTRGCNAVFVDRDWTSVANEQAEDRLHRITQLRSVTIWRLIAKHAVDQRVEEVTNEKAGLIEAVFGEEIRAEEEVVA